MRRHLGRVVLLILIPCFVSSSDERVVNLVRNPGFERGITGWRTPWHEQGADILTEIKLVHAGRACLLLHADNKNVGIDSEPIYTETDFDVGEQHTLSAYVSNLGITRGGFGLRLYFYDANGKYLSMKSFGDLSVESPKSGWHRIEARIGPGTGTPFPKSLDHLVIRFSFWAKEGASNGKVLIDDVTFGPLQSGPPVTTRTVKRAPKGAIAIWHDQVPVVGAASDPVYLASLLGKAGFGVHFVTTQDLTDRRILNSSNFDLLVLPYGECYPAHGGTALRRFLRTGGDLLTLGGRCFAKPIFKTPHGWITTSARKSNSQLPKPITKLSRVFVEALADDMRKGDNPADVSLVKDDTGDPALRILLPDLQTYRYVPLKACGIPGYTIIHFRARGDANTRYLCIEANETDRSRWKAVVDLSTEWQEYELSTGEFLSYATEGRGGKGDFLHAGRISKLLFGFPASLVGKGRHVFEFSHVEWRGSDIPPQDMVRPPILLNASPAIQRAFGAQIRSGGGSGDIATFFHSKPFHDVTALHPAPGQFVFAKDAEVAERSSGWTVTTLEDNLHLIRRRKASHRRDFLPTEKLTRTVPLLVTPGGDPAASLFIHIGGKYRDSVWACFGVTNRDLFAAGNEAMGKSFARLVEHMLNEASFQMIGPRFRVVDGKAMMETLVDIANPSRVDRQIELRALLLPLHGKRPIRDVTRSVSLSPGATTRVVAFQAEAADFDWRQFRVQCDLISSGQVLDHIATSVDVRGTFLALCDRLVERQQERGDGKFHGYAFDDNRGTRGLLAAYDLSGRGKYLDAAIRWGNAIIGEQRKDGGYLMGYGYRPEGNACYVADGGEIACGIARLIQYVPKKDKPRFLNSLKAYMAYRDSFRCEGGGIGVGWCWNDYGARPIKKLDKLTRIYSPENNIYTIGCTLTCAIMYAQITKDVRVNDAAVGDCYWWMERAKSAMTGASVESAIWANKFLTGGTIKKDTQDFLREKFISQAIQTQNHWWRGGGGRSVQCIDGLAYYYDCVEKDPNVLAALMRATYHICSPEALAGIPRILPKEKLTWGEWCYLNFAAVSLPDLIQSEIIRKPF
ncbi:MAG: hypothetical protein GXP25_13655 [Planctomycetes bacterium]|nr:hypothetical protein [Planctomycetota bacterium]